MTLHHRRHILEQLEARVLLASFAERFEAASAQTYVPTEDGTRIEGDMGPWLLFDTISNFPEEGPTPQRGQIISSGGSKALKLTSVVSDTDAADNVWVVYAPELIGGTTITLDASSAISFKNSGLLDNPEVGGAISGMPPSGDTVYLAFEDNVGNLLVYIMQRNPSRPARSAGDSYREILLDPAASAYSRNLFTDFSTIPSFAGAGATIRTITFSVAEHGNATFDDLVIGPDQPPPPVPPTATLSEDGTLMVNGRSSNVAKERDLINITRDAKGRIIYTNKAEVQVFAKGAVKRILGTLNGGEDFLQIGPGVPSASISGGNHNDILIGGDGNDDFLGAAQNDQLYGGGGDDSLRGGGGKDKLFGQAGSDLLLGGAGDDALIDRDGAADTLSGGKGYDIGQLDDDQDLWSSIEELLA